MVVLALALGGASLLGGCKGGAATPTERLWVSGIPTAPTTELTAFVSMQADAKREGYLGAFFHGTLYRGGHDVFEWRDTGKDRASVKFLQDGKRAKEIKLELRACKPTTGFDYCLEVRGSTSYAGTYYSRKRWVVRKPGRKRDAAAGLVTHALLELAQDDDELARALDAAAEAAGVSDE